VGHYNTVRGSGRRYNGGDALNTMGVLQHAVGGVTISQGVRQRGERQ